MAKAKAANGDAAEKDALQALNKISQVAARAQAAPAARAAVDIKNLCKTYNQIRPLLERALPLIERIPVYGKKIADAIRILMQIADVACAFG
jgi:hypothetical protein